MIPVDEIRLKVRGHYKDALAAGTCGCGDCCAPSTSPDALEDFIGPALGCGSPVTHAELRPGEVVVDLGSRNGLTVDGRHTNQNVLQDGDRIGFGSVEAVFRVALPGGSQGQRSAT